MSSINYWIVWATDQEKRILGRAVLLATIAIKTAQHLFNDMMTSVLREPISVFVSTPSSQILNRLQSSTDQSTIMDKDIPCIIFLMSQVIIPQDPTLFQGTVRTNLDPLEQHYSDQEIWEVINNCRLGEIIRQDQRLLDAPVAEDGENWSLGQRQLVCLARVLIKKRRIYY